MTAGFPCQPYSRQGDRLGSLDSRSDTLHHILRATWLRQSAGVWPLFSSIRQYWRPSIALLILPALLSRLLCLSWVINGPAGVTVGSCTLLPRSLACSSMDRKTRASMSTVKLEPTHDVGSNPYNLKRCRNLANQTEGRRSMTGSRQPFLVLGFFPSTRLFGRPSRQLLPSQPPVSDGFKLMSLMSTLDSVPKLDLGHPSPMQSRRRRSPRRRSLSRSMCLPTRSPLCRSSRTFGDISSNQGGVAIAQCA